MKINKKEQPGLSLNAKVGHNEEFFPKEPEHEPNGSETKNYGNWIGATKFGRKVKDIIKKGNIGSPMNSPLVGFISPIPKAMAKRLGLVKISPENPTQKHY